MKKHIILGLVAFLVTLLGLSNPAFAEQVTEAVPSTYTLSPWILAIVTGTVTPILTGLVTKLGASSPVKALTGFVLMALGTVINLIVTNNGTFVIRDAIVLFATTFVVHAAMYLNLWKPVGGGAPPGAKSTANFGIG